MGLYIHKNNFSIPQCFSVYEPHNSETNRKILANKLHYSFLSQLSCFYCYFCPKKRALSALSMSKTIKIILCDTRVLFSGPVLRMALEYCREFQSRCLSFITAVLEMLNLCPSLSSCFAFLRADKPSAVRMESCVHLMK